MRAPLELDKPAYHPFVVEKVIPKAHIQGRLGVVDYGLARYKIPRRISAGEANTGLVPGVTIACPPGCSSSNEMREIDCQFN